MGASGSQSDSSSESFIDPTQLGYLNQLWGAGQNLMQQYGAGAYGAASQGLVNQFMPFGMAGGEAFAAGAGGNLAGQQQLAQNMTEESPWLAGQIENLGSDISQNLAQNVLPQIRAGGIAAGQGPSGGRAGLGQGLAAQEAQRQFANQATQLRAQDLQRRQNAALGLTQSQLASSQGALGAMGQLYNLGFQPWQAQWLPLQMQAGLLGRPAVVGQGESDSMSAGISFA